MTYAIVKIQGKQYKVTSGDTVVVDRVDSKEGDKMVLDQVLLEKDGDKTVIGSPTTGTKLEAEVVKHQKGDKLRVSTYKSKSRYRRTVGHRQYQTQLKILGVAK